MFYRGRYTCRKVLSCSLVSVNYSRIHAHHFNISRMFFHSHHVQNCEASDPACTIRDVMQSIRHKCFWKKITVLHDIKEYIYFLLSPIPVSIHFFLIYLFSFLISLIYSLYLSFPWCCKWVHLSCIGPYIWSLKLLASIYKCKFKFLIQKQSVCWTLVFLCVHCINIIIQKVLEFMKIYIICYTHQKVLVAFFDLMNYSTRSVWCWRWENVRGKFFT